MALAACQHDGSGELSVDVQQVGRWVAHEGAAQVRDLALRARDHLGMQAAQELVDLEELVVPVRRETSGLAGRNGVDASSGLQRWTRANRGLVDAGGIAA